MANLHQALASEAGGNSSKAFFAYISEKAAASGTPLTGTFELTPRCTLDCAMCYVHLKPEQMYRLELTTEQWLDIIDQACDAGMLFAKVTGGECMLHPGFRRICEALFNRGIIVSILTNGTLIDEETANWIARYPVEVVQVTVYGSSPEGYAAVTGNPGAFFKVDRALTLLKEKGIRFTTPITLSRQLAPEFTTIVSYCLSKESLHMTVSPNPFPARPETGRQSDDYSLTPLEEVELLKKYCDLKGIACEPCSLDETILSDTQRHAIDGIACKAGKSAFAISWDGYMMPCNAVYWIKSEPLIRGFQGAWNEIRETARAFQYPDKCAACGLKSACTHCPVAHYDVTVSAGQTDSMCKDIFTDAWFAGFRMRKKSCGLKNRLHMHGLPCRAGLDLRVLKFGHDFRWQNIVRVQDEQV